MAKTGDTSDRKPKARSRAARPSFTPAAPPAAGSAWVYRSDDVTAPAAAVAPPMPSPSAATVTAPVAAVKAVKTVAPRQAPSPVVPSARRASRVTHALDVVTLPIALSLMAVLAPMRRLLGPRH